MLHRFTLDLHFIFPLSCLVSLFEQALAKHYGSFARLNGGNTSEALWDLTGCGTHRTLTHTGFAVHLLALTSPPFEQPVCLAVEDIKLDGDGASKLSPSACATLVSDALKRGDLVACGHIDTKKRGDYAAVCEGGVRMNHAFAVVGASTKEAKVYNPMGVDDGYTNGKTDGAGTLTMSWAEFTKSYTRLQLCRRSSRSALPFHRSWRSGSDGGVVLSWRVGRSAGGCTNFSSFRRNPMLRLPKGGEAKRKATIEAVVGQKDRRGDTGGEALSYPQLGMCVVRLREGASWPCVTAENYEVVAKSGAFWNKREVGEASSSFPHVFYAVSCVRAHPSFWPSLTLCSPSLGFSRLLSPSPRSLPRSRLTSAALVRPFLCPPPTIPRRRATFGSGER